MTVHVLGTSPYDRRLHVSSSHSICDPEPVRLPAGAVLATVSCTAQPVTRSGSEWLNVTEEQHLAARSIVISPAPATGSRPAG